MSFLKVILSFSRNFYNDLELIAKAFLIGQHMADNPHFPTPLPSLEDLNAALGKFTLSVSKAIDGSKEDTIIKNKDRLALEKLLQQLGLYVQTISDGEEDIIVSSGFDLHKKPAPIGPLEQATGLVVRYGVNSGEVTLECNVIPNARNYDFSYTDAPITPETIWISNICSKSQLNLAGLTSGIYYEFRVAGINTDPQRNWSEPVRKLMV